MTSVTFKPNMPLYIPRLFPEHADESYIAGTFFQQGLGQVERVDLIAKEQPEQVLLRGVRSLLPLVRHPFSSRSPGSGPGSAGQGPGRALPAGGAPWGLEAGVLDRQRVSQPRDALSSARSSISSANSQTKQALADFEEFHLLRTVEDQARLINQLFALVDHQARELARYGYHDTVIVPETRARA